MAEDDSRGPDLGPDIDDDEALRYAIALSLEEPNNKAESNGKAASTGPEVPPRKATFGSLSLDRRNMEEERLLRLSRKRQRSPSDGEITEVPSPKRKAPIEDLSTSQKPSLMYPNGAVKRTWVRGNKRSSTDITIEEIFQKEHLSLAVLSSFQWDDEWLLSKLDLRNSKLLLLAFAADNGQKEMMRSNVPPSVRFCFPPMNGPGAMHAKLQLLKYPNYLRIVLPTGNLVPHDWGETGVMENMVFLIDLPRLSNSIDHSPTNFSMELGRFLGAMGVEERLVASLRNYDFSQTTNLGFVYTIPGSHMDDDRMHTGYCGLAASVAALGLSTSEPVEIDLACASLGSLNRDFVGAIYQACQGNDGLQVNRGSTGRNTENEASAVPESLQRRFRIYFPKDQTVARSRGGRNAGGTICVQAKWWISPKFPRELMHDCVNTREGLLMHTKIILVRRTTRTGRPEAQGWAYVGSANLSESAWGRLVKDRSTGKAKMYCRNWECGVVVPVPSKEPLASATETEPELTIFDGTIPVPMRVPAAPYAADDKPWYFLGE